MGKLTEQPLKKKIRNFITLNSVTKDEIRQEYNEIFDKLKEYEDKQEWISVDERLPNKHEFVLTYTERKALEINFIASYGEWFEIHEYGKPTHWMPLPPKPKMKGAENE